METYERGDPTQVVTENRPNRDPDFKRFTPTLRLLARDAAIETFATKPGQEAGNPLTVTLYGGRSLRAQSTYAVTENPTTELDDRYYVGGWDFVGDAPDPGASGLDPNGESWLGPVRSPEYGAGSTFKRMAGGFENYRNIPIDPMDLFPNTTPYPGDVVRFTWTLGLRELIRAGFDPDVDDHLTIRVRGREQEGLETAAIVGEVLTNPIMTVVNPGEERVDGYQAPTVDYNPLNILGFDGFTKLRDGDTALTVDLRSSFDDLYEDLDGSSDTPEPLVVLRILMRKTTPDYQTLDDNYYFYSIELSSRGRVGNDNAANNNRLSLIAGTTR